MSEHIQNMIKEIQMSKEKEKNRLAKISWKKTRKTRDIVNEEKKEKLLNKEVDVGLPKVKPKEEIYQEMENKFRMAWKSPGYLNSELSKIPTLRGKILNEWEIERIYLAERSYKAPKNFKGFKIPSQYQEFPRAKTPKNFQEHLDKFRLKYDDFVQRPTKYGKVFDFSVHEDELIENVKINNKEPFRVVNTVQFNEFGFATHNTWEAELHRKGLRTLSAIKQ